MGMRFVFSFWKKRLPDCAKMREASLDPFFQIMEISIYLNAETYRAHTEPMLSHINVGTSVDCTNIFWITKMDLESE